MVATTDKNSIPYPKQGDSPNEATAMANLVGQIDRRMVPRFSTTADRTTRVPSPSDGMFGYVAANGRHEIYRAGAWNPLAFTKTAIKTADTTRTLTITPTADPHLTVAVTSGHVYIVDVNLFFQGDPGVDMLARLSLPTNSNGNSFNFGATPTQTSPAASIYARSGAAFSGVAVTPNWQLGCVTSPNTASSNLRWIIGTNSSGSITLDFAQAVSSALGTTLLATSFMSVTMVS